MSRLFRNVHHHGFGGSSLRWLGIDSIAEPKGTFISLVELRSAEWTGVTRDTRPIKAL
jgi:hypothetical protein